MKKLIFPLIAIATLIGCKNDDTTTPVNTDRYTSGYFVVNEGNFTRNNADISYIKNDLSTGENQLFNQANNRILGDVAQSVIQNGQYVFIVVNNSNTVEVVDKKTFKSVKTITEELHLPRYATISANKLWVTNSNNKVSSYNLSDFSVSTTITLDYTPEYIESTADYIYISTGPWTAQGKINLYNATNNTLINTKNFDKAIKGITKNQNTLYTLTANDQGSEIYKVEQDSYNKISENNINSRFLCYQDNKLYYTSGIDIYQLNLGDHTSHKLFSVPDTGWSAIYGFNVIDKKFFISNAKSFTETGEIEVYNHSGVLEKNIKVGIGPNAVHKIQ